MNLSTHVGILRRGNAVLEHYISVNYIDFFILYFTGPGETVTIAEEMAARDALSKILGTGLEKKPFKFEQTKPHVDISNIKLEI